MSQPSGVLGARNPTTIREHLEANEQLLGFALNAADVAAPITLEEAIKQARKHAVAAIAILDAAKLDIFTSRFDRVPESEWVDAVRLAPETRHVSIPDPDPGVGAEHA